MDENQKAVIAAAVSFLARREYGEQELRQRLLRKGFPAQDIETAIQSLRQRGAQSDQRYAESYCRSRLEKGFGPLRIAAELKQKGVADALVEQTLEEHRADWEHQMRRVFRKHFGRVAVTDIKERAKQWRYLQYRGFNVDQIRELFDESQ